MLSFGILKNGFVSNWHDIKYQLVQIFCSLEGLRSGCLSTWFCFIKLLPVCILVVLWDFDGVVSWV